MNRNKAFYKLCRHLSNCFRKCLHFFGMRRFLMKAVNRVLLLEPFTAAVGTEAQMDARACRKLVVGLGNPGMDGIRHSVGMAVLGALASRLGVADRWRGDKYVSGEVILSEVQNTQMVLLRPRLLMNVNGVSVAKAAAKFNIKPEDILLVHDEIDKPLGKIAIKHGGSPRGHNGVRSCVDCLQTDVMPRLRVGIGRPAGKTSVERHVLSRFSSEERKVLDSVLIQSVDLLLSHLCQQDAQSPASPAGGRQAARQSSASPTAEAGTMNSVIKTTT